MYNRFAAQIAALQRLIQSWQLIKVNSRSELDEFSDKLLIALGRGGGVEKIKRIIESELCIGFGLYKNEFDADKLASQIVSWYNNSPTNN